MKNILKYLFINCFIVITILSIYNNLIEAKSKEVDLSNKQEIVSFCYHNVVDSNEKNLKDLLKKDIYAITDKQLENHFKFFKEKGYTPISIKQYQDYLEKGIKLPEKPILISFDDGHESMYTKIYPLLKKYNYHAVFGIILSNMDGIPENSIKKMVTWEQLQEMKASGLVEVGVHSYDLHEYIIANSYRDITQKAINGIYEPNQKRYETEAEYKERIRTDLINGKELFYQHMGYEPQIFVWPFGEYNEFLIDETKQAGYKYQLLLGNDKKVNDTSLLSRYIITNDLSTSDILKYLEHTYKVNNIVAGQIDIDMIYDELPEKFERNIDDVINKLHDMNANTVFVQAFADEDRDGNVDEVYFHTDNLKVKADVFNHVVNRLKDAGFKVYAWIPILTYSQMTQNPDNLMVASEPDKIGWYKRATPFSPEVRAMAKDIVKDLTMYSSIDGILFQDDLYMNDFEDFSVYAKEAFRNKFNKELTMENLNNDADLRNKWTKLKTKTLNDFTLKLINVAKEYKGEIKTARNIYPTLITEPESEEWFAQNYNDFLSIYDYVVIMAYPEMENAENEEQVEPKEWLEHLVTMALENPQAKTKAIFKLQGYDWDKNIWIKDTEQISRQKLIHSKGGLNLAQYPVNVFDN